MEWKGKVINKFDEKTKTLSNKTSSKFYKSGLQQNNPVNTLNNNYNQFLVTPINNAIGNVALFIKDFMHLFLEENRA